MLPIEPRRLRTILNRQLRVKILKMRLHGKDADVEQGCNLFVLAAVCHEYQNLSFARRQLVESSHGFPLSVRSISDKNRNNADHSRK